jgi:hypothetical protein
MSIHSMELPAWETDANIEPPYWWEFLKRSTRWEDIPLVTWRGQCAIRPKVAFKLLGVGNTHGYELINAGELETYREGRARLITVRSVFFLIARRLAANIPPPSQSPVPPPTKTSPLPPIQTLSPPKRPRGRPRNCKTERAQIDLQTKTACCRGKTVKPCT